MMWKVLRSQARRFPWICNVAWYSCIFAAGDLAQQSLLKEEKVDFKQTRNAALLALGFHGNFVYLWMKAVENVFPGTAAGTILWKVVCDQLVVTPTGISAFYIGMSAMEGKQDILAIWRENFWNTYKVINYRLVPVFFRMAYFGCWGFVWIIFISHLRQRQEGAAESASESFTINKNSQSENRYNNFLKTFVK
ncbi:mpv17-like protein isoform X3 [Heterodontus francisci]|uniref:mpv17-like protein isoform X3 n=1 Tax=Heterodontus francisci TaxID=7792 RepID=UPI00355BCA60